MSNKKVSAAKMSTVHLLSKANKLDSTSIGS